MGVGLVVGLLIVAAVAGAVFVGWPDGQPTSVEEQPPIPVEEPGYASIVDSLDGDLGAAGAELRAALEGGDLAAALAAAVEIFATEFPASDGPFGAARAFLDRRGSVRPDAAGMALEVEARAGLLDAYRSALDAASALAVRPALRGSVARLLAAEPGPDAAADALPPLLQAGIVDAQLDSDLGRWERAEERLFELEAELAPLAAAQEDPAAWSAWIAAVVGLARNQLRFQAGRLDRMQVVDGAMLDDFSALQLESYLLRRDLRLAADEARQGAGDARARAAAVEAAGAFLDAHPDAPSLTLSVGFDLVGLALVDRDIALAREERARVERSASELVDAGALPPELRAILVDTLGARIDGVGARSDADRAALAARLQSSWSILARAWADSPTLAGGIGFLANPIRRDLLCQTLRLTLDVDGPEAAFAVLAETQALGTSERELGFGAPTLETLRDALDRRGVGALAFVPGELETLVCALGAGGARWFSCPPLVRHAAELDALRRELTQPTDDAELAALAARLGRAFFPPDLVAWIADRRELVLIGADLLGTGDLETLELGTRGPLGLALPVSYAPSLPWLAHLAAIGRDLPAGPRRSIAVCATELAFEADGLGALEPLPYTPFVRAALVGDASDGATLLRAGDATRSALERRLTGDVDVLAYLGHGLQDFGRAIPTGLLVAGRDGRGAALWSEDLERLSAPPVCFVMACRASRGHARRGDGNVASAAGALLRAGAHAVVASARDLDMAVALELFEVWRRADRGGATTAEALLVAKRALDPERLSPHRRAAVLQTHGAGWAR